MKMIERCCLISSTNFNTTRIVSLLERRLKRNSSRISFDFKCLTAEKTERNAKISRSLLKIQPKNVLIDETSADLTFSSSNEDEDEQQEQQQQHEETSNRNDEYLDGLASWIPNETPQQIDEETEEEVEEEEIPLRLTPIVSVNPVETQQDENEDLQVIFTTGPMKNEANFIPQLDGQTDLRQVSRRRRRKRPTPLIHALIPRLPPRQSLRKSKRKRSENYFRNCISIDDDSSDEIEEIVRPKSFLSDENVRSHRQILSETINTSVMRIKWLTKLENLLVEQIFLGEKNGKFKIDASFLTMIFTNFLQMFCVRHVENEDEELAFYQNAWTGFLRYFLLQNESIVDEQNELTSLLNLFFDLLFDLIDADLCERGNDKSRSFRSTLIRNEYFHRKFSSKNFFRIKILFYFIELIVAQQNLTNFSFHRTDDLLFQWAEDALRHIVTNRNLTFRDERISICLSSIELCFLVVSNKTQRVEKIVEFLVDIAEKNFDILRNFLFDENFLVDFRLLFLNEFISKRFGFPLSSLDELHRFLSQLDFSDETQFLLGRSLFNSYADLMIETQPNFFINTIQSAQVTTFLRNYLDFIQTKLNETCSDEKLRIFFRLLKFKWKRFP